MNFRLTEYCLGGVEWSYCKYVRNSPFTINSSVKVMGEELFTVEHDILYGEVVDSHIGCFIIADFRSDDPC